jgi:hypothetical protein
MKNLNWEASWSPGIEFLKVNGRGNYKFPKEEEYGAASENL